MAPKQRNCDNSKTLIEEREQNSEQINYQLWIYIFLVINVMLIILCILTADFTYTEDEPFIQDANLCIRCSELKIHPDDHLQNILVYGDTCCAQPDHLEDFVHAFAYVWYRKKLNKENPRYRDCRETPEVTPKPAIKLIGARNNHADILSMKVYWDEEAFNRNPDILRNAYGTILVKKSGVYFIYIQIEFLYDFNKRTPMSYLEYDVIQVAQQPLKGREEIIMKSSNTPSDCCTDNGPANNTRYVGTTLYLSKGDLIYVKVFHWYTVRQHSWHSFFGMHRVE